MLRSGDVVDLDLGVPEGREAGFLHPGVVVTAQRVLDEAPAVLQVVPLTSRVRWHVSEVAIEPDDANGLSRRSAAQCQHVRGVSVSRLRRTRGNVGIAVLAQIRETLAVLIDLPLGGHYRSKPMSRAGADWVIWLVDNRSTPVAA